VGIVCREETLEFETPYELAASSARHCDANLARLRELGHCGISQTIGPAGSAATHLYAPDSWIREEGETRFPEFAEHNAEMAAYHFEFAEQLSANPKRHTTAYQYNMAMVEERRTPPRARGARARAAHC
jgi:hypothetical protein